MQSTNITKLTLTALSLLAYLNVSHAKEVLLDDFEDLSDWRIVTSEGVELEIAQDEGRTGMGMRLDFDFHGRGGFMIARKELSMQLAEYYAFSFDVRADAPLNNFAYKLVGPENQNVWWWNQSDFKFPDAWEKMTLKERHLEFAWGPSEGEALSDISAIEFAISAGSEDGKGSIWIDDLRFEERVPVSKIVTPPIVTASTTANDYDPAWLLDKNPKTTWKSGSVAEVQWLQIDFQDKLEYGGLIIDWDEDDYAQSYEIQISNDGIEWQRVFSIEASNGGRDYVYIPETESKFLRIALHKSSQERGYGIDAIEIKSPKFSSSPNNLFKAIARDAKPGTYPRYLSGKQSFWTVVGLNGDTKEALINEEGMVETEKSQFSVEPFLHMNGQFITWEDVKLTHKLQHGYLPIPTVSWEHADIKLDITALAAGKAEASTLYLKYLISNHTDTQQTGRLYLTLRPFQVSPPWQSLNMTGGVSRISEIRFDGESIQVNNQKSVVPLTPAARFGATKFAQGDITDFILNGDLPVQTEIIDEFGYASGALEYDFELPPGKSKSVVLVIPFHEASPRPPIDLTDEEAQKHWNQVLTDTQTYWNSRLNIVEIDLPESVQKISDTLKTTLAYILINRDGPAIQPGSRNYERSWIRDGALTSSALLQMGHAAPVREFIEWYAMHLNENGKVPCCVDFRGADPVPENDSHGEWIYLIMEYYRFVRDIGFLTEMWPSVKKTVEYIDYLRQQRMTEEYQTPENNIFYGLVPESISHEGYASRPVHSYWDDFFILRGLKDATSMAQILGEEETAISFAKIRDEFRRDLYNSIKRSIERHNIDYIPGAAELGDFDATATTISIDPGGELAHLPQPALTRTFSTYLQHFHKRINNEIEWEAYTPYELRVVGTFIRMGLEETAHEILEYFFNSHRPAAWNQWGEIVWNGRDTPKFIGDLPHTWVGSDYIRAVRSFFAFERETDQALVLAAGIPSSWIANGEEINIKRLPTHFGTINYSLRSHGDNRDKLRLFLSGDLNIPPGKIIVRSPMQQPLTRVAVNGRDVQSFDADEVVIDQFPVEVILSYAP